MFFLTVMSKIFSNQNPEYPHGHSGFLSVVYSAWQASSSQGSVSGSTWGANALYTF